MELCVVIDSGKDLAAKDSNGLSDPYCTVNWRNKKFRTRVCKATLCPVWKECFFLGDFDPTKNEVLEVEVWDKDRFASDDFMGRVRLVMSNFDKVGLRKEMYPLQTRGRDKEEVSGQLRLEFIVKSKDLAVPQKAAAPTKKGKEMPPRLGRMDKTISTLKCELCVAPDLPTRVFGVSLEDQMKRQKGKYPDLTVPHFPKRLIQYFHDHPELWKTVGIFRVAGSKSAMEHTKELIDVGDIVDFDSIKDPHHLAGILKCYFAELPEPVLTFEQYPNFLAVCDAPSKAAKVLSIRATLSQLPEVNRLLLSQYLRLIHLLLSHTEDNQMGPQAFAIVIAPTVAWDPTGNGIGDIATTYGNILKITNTVELMITEYEPIFVKKSGSVRYEPPPPDRRLQRSKLLVDDQARVIFDCYDHDKGGSLDYNEFQHFFRDLLLTSQISQLPSQAEIDDALENMDADGNGEITFDEFVVWWRRVHKKYSGLARTTLQAT
mmetsp:Transcript_20021/g.50799  ORF Transcript_20021/g.50799 Transcript_20021/m.50799 type:complete len:488 (-) Transcript_20021:115-1578(-)|eukprot:CAMPEP_0177640428 /NCGR_PEP_ID=MMETSP0447-20121125/6537_1 /TAXON_ID=0 /ORGANISM="Stygamoeba regulata, Strain BSH-02190019" /LENGTH=487 /DNA_ID=CAMNT_0019142497 /DNA_START=155 /DNA_END=1618 /DNA_ORIENTATION=-